MTLVHRIKIFHYQKNMHLFLPIVRNLTTTNIYMGIDEFFPSGVYEKEKYVDDSPVAGRKWKISELRIRSSSDLHKLWYVLLKERNMLMTLGQECKRLGIPVPGPTRLHKVKQTMNSIKTVIEERNSAILTLEKQRSYSFDNVTDNEAYLKQKLKE